MLEPVLARPPVAHWRALRAHALSSLDEVFDLLHSRADGGAPLPWMHALQTAERARRGGACDALITAALLHDIGHLAGDDAPPEDRAQGHAEVGAAMLAELFPPIVTEPIRLHWQAARYLTATQPVISRALSMTEEERLLFMTHRHAGHALRLSHWDEAEHALPASRQLVLPFRRIAQRCLRDDDDFA